MHSAVIDALSHLGIRHIDMPCTPEKVWRAVQAAESGQQPEIWSDPPAMFRDLPEGRATDAPDPDAPQA